DRAAEIVLIGDDNGHRGDIQVCVSVQIEVHGVHHVREDRELGAVGVGTVDIIHGDVCPSAAYEHERSQNTPKHSRLHGFSCCCDTSFPVWVCSECCAFRTALSVTPLWAGSKNKYGKNQCV